MKIQDILQNKKLNESATSFNSAIIEFTDFIFSEVLDIRGDHELTDEMSKELNEFLLSLEKTFPKKHTISEIDFEDHIGELNVTLSSGLLDYIYNFSLDDTDAKIFISVNALVKDKYISKRYIQKIYSKSNGSPGMEHMAFALTDSNVSRILVIPKELRSQSDVVSFKNHLNSTFTSIQRSMSEFESSASAFSDWYLELSSRMDPVPLCKQVINNYPVKVWTVDCGYIGFNSSTGEIFKD